MINRTSRSRYCWWIFVLYYCCCDNVGVAGRRDIITNRNDPNRAATTIKTKSGSTSARLKRLNSQNHNNTQHLFVQSNGIDATNNKGINNNKNYTKSNDKTNGTIESNTRDNTTDGTKQQRSSLLDLSSESESESEWASLTSEVPTPFSNPPITSSPTTAVQPSTVPPTESNHTTPSPVTSVPFQPSSSVAPTTAKPVITVAPTVVPTVVPTYAPTNVIPTTISPTSQPSAAATSPTNDHHHPSHAPKFLRIVGKAIAWLILTCLGMLGIAFFMNNRYRFYYYIRYFYYRFLSLNCTRQIRAKLHQALPFLFGSSSDDGLDTNLNTVIFDDGTSNMSEGLLMSENNDLS